MTEPVETAQPLTEAEEQGIRSGWWEQRPNRGALATGYVARLLATIDALRAEATRGAGAGLREDRVCHERHQGWTEPHDTHLHDHYAGENGPQRDCHNLTHRALDDARAKIAALVATSPQPTVEALAELPPSLAIRDAAVAQVRPLIEHLLEGEASRQTLDAYIGRYEQHVRDTVPEALQAAWLAALQGSRDKP